MVNEEPQVLSVSLDELPLLPPLTNDSNNIADVVNGSTDVLLEHGWAPMNEIWDLCLVNVDAELETLWPFGVWPANTIVGDDEHHTVETGLKPHGH